MTLACPVADVRREAAYLGYVMHWSLAEILSLSHADRVAWVGEARRLEAERNEGSGG